MKVTLDGFRQDTLVKYNLDGNDSNFLRWFMTFTNESKMRKIIDEDGEIFYWIKYTKVIDDLPAIFKNIFTVRRKIKEYSDKKILQLKLSRDNGMGGPKTYFRFYPGIIDELENTKMESLITGNEIKPEIKNTNKKKHPYNKNVFFLFEKIVSIKNNYDGDFIFKHKIPEDNYHYTVKFSKFQNQMISLYEGRFLTNNRVDSLKDWYKKQYGYYLNKTNEIQTKINSCKGSWTNIEKVVLNSIKNYQSWFDSDSEKNNKEVLPRNIDEFIFCDFNKTSMFYVCLLEKCSTNITVATEKIYNNLPSKITALVNPILKRENYDEDLFYRKINQLVKWYDKNMNWLCSKDSNCQYWLSTRTGFMENYLEWISDTIGKHPKIGNFGIDNKTFNWYVETKIKEHDIGITIPRSLK